MIVVLFGTMQAALLGAEMVPAKIARHAQRVLRIYDADGDGRLQTAEWRAMPGDLASADADRDGVITVDELAAHLAAYARQHGLRPLEPRPEAKVSGTESERSGEAVASGREGEPRPPGDRSEGKKFSVPASRLPPGLPDWFRERDADGDGQLTLVEFAPKPTRQQLEEFARLDANGDGLLTARECVRGASATSSPRKGTSAARKP